jgi:hypothetical protein
MPAIQLDRLRKQTDELGELFPYSERVVKVVRDLFEFYADRTRRSRRTGEPESVIRYYRVPEPVLRRILFIFGPMVRDNPEQGLLLCDALWAEPVLEFRMLALRLLGEIDADPPGSITERIATWVLDNHEERLQLAMADEALARLRVENVPAFLQMTESLIHSERERAQGLGLQALAILLKERRFENLPVIYRILAPRVYASKSSIRPYLVDVLGLLAEQSAQETAYFLREMLTADGGSKTAEWLTRHSLEAFPTEQKERLRAQLREKRGR